MGMGRGKDANVHNGHCSIPFPLLSPFFCFIFDFDLSRFFALGQLIIASCPLFPAVLYDSDD